MNKRTVLLVSAGLAILALVSGYSRPFLLCNEYWRECMAWNYHFSMAIRFFIPVFLFSLITFRMGDKQFSAWLKFSFIWIPLSIFAVALTPEYRQDFLFGFDKPAVAFYMSLAYVIGSFIAIGYTYLERK